jgi:hypothetical protein
MTMRASSKLFLACLAFFALAALYRVPPDRAGTHATRRVRHAALATPHRTGRQVPARAELAEASVDDYDDDTADDDAGTSLDAGLSAAQAWRDVLADNRVVPESPFIPSLLARSHVHATRAPPCRPPTGA